MLKEKLSRVFDRCLVGVVRGKHGAQLERSLEGKYREIVMQVIFFGKSEMKMQIFLTDFRQFFKYHAARILSHGK